MQIVIAGPGRSGTSLLVRLFASFGFSTSDGAWHDEANAGLEARFKGAVTNDSPEVIKDPWVFDYVNELAPASSLEVRRLIIPLRAREDAVASRMIQERGDRLERFGSDRRHWKRATASSGVPGGAVVGVSGGYVSAALSEGLWDLLEWGVRNDVDVSFLHFPRFVNDFNHLWRSLGDLIGEKCDKDSAFSSWKRIVDPQQVRVRSGRDDVYGHLSKTELVGLIERLQRKLNEAHAGPMGSEELPE